MNHGILFLCRYKFKCHGIISVILVQVCQKKPLFVDHLTTHSLLYQYLVNMKAIVVVVLAESAIITCPLAGPR